MFNDRQPNKRVKGAVMKEQELDKYIGKYVTLIDFTNTVEKGILYKIVNGKFTRNNKEKYTPINNGYFLDRNFNGGICYRKSHIKKIKELKEWL